MSQFIAPLFNQYKQGFVDYCAHSIAACYRSPYAIADGDGVNVHNTHDNLLSKFTKNFQGLKAHKLVSADYRVLTVTQISENAVAVDLEWSISFATSHMTFKGHYVCQKSDTSWLIFSVQL